jgi:hypothetical protein
MLPKSNLDFKVAYASALLGTSSLSPDPKDQKPGMEAILDLIISEISGPKVDAVALCNFSRASSITMTLSAASVSALSIWNDARRRKHRPFAFR